MSITPKKRKNICPRGLFREIFVSANRELATFGTVFVYLPENFEQKRLGTVFGLIKISDNSPESSFVANLLASVIKKEYFSKPNRPVYDSFEASLKKANLALAELARQGSVKWIEKIDFAGGALEKNNLHFSKLGTTSILLLRGGMLADIGSGLDLDEDIAEVDSHPIKTFSNISSGKVELGDRLVFTTSDLLEIFSFEEIRQNAARFSRKEFPEIISASLTANSELSGTIIVSMVSTEEAADQPLPSFTAKEHPDRLIGDPPENISLVSSARPAHAPPLSVTKKENRLFVSESEDLIPEKSFAKNILLSTKSGALVVWKKFYRLFRQIEWPRKNKKILAIVGTIVVLIVASFSFFKIFSREKASAPIPQPAPVAESNATPSDINAKNIGNISEVAALPAESNGSVFMNDSLFFLSGDKSILKIDLASGATEKSDSDVGSGNFTMAAAMPDLNTIFILTADKKIISFTPSNKKFLENAISLPDNLNASDIKAYLTYIYILDSNTNQIYRYPRAEGGFGERQDWLKSGQDIKSADKFAINNHIFAADNSSIIPLLQGKIDSAIEFEKPQTPLRVDAIYTDTDFANVYVLDNMNHRIIVYTKDGKIAAQYFNPQISDVKHIVADEKNKLIYLQKTDSVSKFSME